MARSRTPADLSGALATLDTLMAQKTKSLADGRSEYLRATNIFEIFERPISSSDRDTASSYRALAAQPGFVHVSRLDVGPETVAANLGLISATATIIC